MRAVLGELLRLGRQGLRSQGAPAEAVWIDLLERRLADGGGCPARRLLDDWGGGLGRDPERLVGELGRNTLPGAA